MGGPNTLFTTLRSPSTRAQQIQNFPSMNERHSIERIALFDDTTPYVDTETRSPSKSSYIDTNETSPTRTLNLTTRLPAGRKSLSRCISLPPQVDYSHSTLLLHPLLSFSPTHQPQLYFDMSTFPLEPHLGCFEEAATFPALPSFAIIVPSVPWTLVVLSSRTSYVTIGDVVTSLWKMLQLPLDGLPDTMGKRRRRIDLLRGRHLFRGLSESDLGTETFLLNIS